MPGSSCVDLRFESPTGVVAESRVTSATSAASDSDTSSGTVATPSDVTVTVSARPRFAAAPRATGSDSATVSVCVSVYVPGCHLQLSEYMGKYLLLCLFSVAFSALTLLVGRQEGHPAHKKLEWWSAGVVIYLERGADLHMAQLKPLPLTVSCFSKIQIGLPFWYRLTRVVLDKGLLNGCFPDLTRSVAFSALTLLVEGHPAGKNLSDGASLNAHVYVFRSMCL